MTAVVLPLPETDQSVIRPVVVSIVDQIIRYLQLPQGINIVYPAELERVPQPGSLLQDRNRDSLMEAATRITVQASERYGSSFIGSNPISRTFFKPIFNDKKLKVAIKPVYTKAKMELNLKYSDTSRTAIMQWRDMTRMRLSSTFDTTLNHVDYHYLIPDQYLELLKLIYSYRESQGGYGESFAEYIAENSTDRLTDLSDLIGGNVRLGVREKQIRMIGQIEYDSLLVPPEIDQDGTLWAINWVFRFNYMKPIGAVMDYPILIHNQLLPEKYVTPILDTQIDRILPETADELITSLRGFEIYRLADKYTFKPKALPVPHFDDWYPLNLPTYTHNLVNILCQITPDNLQTLFNLGDLDFINLDLDILAYFQGVEYPYLTQLYNSFYNLALYEDDQLMDPSYLTVDSNLNVSATIPLDIRKRYHVVICIMTDFTILHRPAFERLAQYPKALVKTITAISPQLNHNIEFFNIKGLNQISIYDIYRIYRFLTGKNDFLTSSEIYQLQRVKPFGYLTGKEWNTVKTGSQQFNTVMISKIIAIEPNIETLAQARRKTPNV